MLKEQLGGNIIVTQRSCNISLKGTLNISFSKTCSFIHLACLCGADAVCQVLGYSGQYEESPDFQCTTIFYKGGS